jgi:eukaryotic-like serine/threonine-protein kinase
VYQQTDQKTANDLWLLPLNGDRKPVPYLQTPFDETGAHFSPDGRWMAYQSNESCRFQIYVQTVPPSGTKYQISSSGGIEARCRRDGKELFYVSADQKLMAVPIKLGATASVSW